MIKDFTKIENDRDILRIGLQNSKGESILDEKGEIVHWVFDFGDIELPSKWNNVETQHRKNVQWLRNQFIIIEKRQDVKGKGFLTKNAEDKIRKTKEFYQKEMDLYDTVLGKHGTKKFLNGRKPYWDMFEDIEEALKPIVPLFSKALKSIDDRIKEKYDTNEKEENILE